MGIKEIEPAQQGIFDTPLWLLLVLAAVWIFFVLREPKDGNTEGWYVPPTIITIAAFVIAAGLGLGS